MGHSIPTPQFQWSVQHSNYYPILEVRNLRGSAGPKKLAQGFKANPMSLPTLFLASEFMPTLPSHANSFSNKRIMDSPKHGLVMGRRHVRRGERKRKAEDNGRGWGEGTGCSLCYWDPVSSSRPRAVPPTLPDPTPSLVSPCLVLPRAYRDAPNISPHSSGVPVRGSELLGPWSAFQGLCPTPLLAPCMHLPPGCEGPVARLRFQKGRSCPLMLKTKGEGSAEKRPEWGLYEVGCAKGPAQSLAHSRTCRQRTVPPTP